MDNCKNALLLLLLPLLLPCLYVTAQLQCPRDCDCLESQMVKCKAIEEFPGSEEIPPNTKQIQFDECKFPHISMVPAYTGVDTLIIINSGVRNISEGAFSDLVELTTLDLAQNHLQHLTQGMFSKLAKVTRLELDGNDIHELQENIFQEMPMLEILSLSSNTRIILQENSFLGNNNLKHLTLDKCGLKTVQTEIFEKVPSLTRLDLGHNPLGSLDKDAFEGLKNLEQLNLPSCSLSSIHEGTFDDLEKLKRLNLGYNELTSIDKHTFHEFEDTLDELYLENNLLESLHHDAVPYKQLSMFSLEGNPWVCDCHIYWMRNVMFIEGENVTCGNPVEVAGLNVKNITSNLECPCDEGICDDDKKMALYIIIPILVVCLLLIAFFVYKIIQNKKKRAKHKSVKYSEVYKETTEAKA